MPAEVPVEYRTRPYECVLTMLRVEMALTGRSGAETLFLPTVMRRIVCVAFLLLVPGIASAQKGRSTFSATVVDAANDTPLGDVEVLLPELKLLVRTDAAGVARIPNVPLGDHRVRVRQLGYEASDVQLKFEGDTTHAQFRLTKAAALGAVNVTTSAVPAQLKDFETRRRQGIGRFLVESDLAKEGSRDFNLVASMRFPGLTVQNDDDNQPHLTGMRSNCGANGNVQATNRGVDRIGQQAGAKPKMGMRDGYEDGDAHGSCESSRACLVQVWLDNINLGESDAGLIRTWDLSGAEYYTGNSVPARYRTSGSACGVLLLWSKWS